MRLTYDMGGFVRLKASNGISDIVLKLAGHRTSSNRHYEQIWPYEQAHSKRGPTGTSSFIGPRPRTTSYRYVRWC